METIRIGILIWLIVVDSQMFRQIWFRVTVILKRAIRFAISAIVVARQTTDLSIFALTQSSLFALRD